MFSVPVYCTYQVSSFLFTNWSFKKVEGRDLVKEVRTLEKLDFKLKKAILDLDFLISCRKNSVFPKFLQFRVSNKQLSASKAYISCQKRLLNQEINNKQKAVKSIQQKVTEVKYSLNCKMSYIDYVHVSNTFLVSNNKNISKDFQKRKTRNYTTLFLEIWETILTNAKILIKLCLIFQAIT